ncbi:MAG: RagB/SusD family nutrient uptake outer membrane protein [Prevotellaceae bacterium]|nr:RagB/SusD family nutrient uptake outer membrane protein [Prevotellaceae bacterium]
MKNLTKTTSIFALLCAAGCTLNYSPDNAITQEQIKTSAEGAAYATIGNYSLFKDVLTFRNADESKNTYIRHYFQATEFKSDNISISLPTSDELYDCMVYNQTPDNTPTAYLWYVIYKMVVSASGVIEAVQDGASPALDNMKGENLFMRALGHLHLVTLFAQPYGKGRDNPGVVVRTSSDVKETRRATVGYVYDQIVADLKDAARLMTIDKGAGYASKAAAYGLLSRVYLYMEQYDDAIKAADDCLALRPEADLTPTAALPAYFANALSSRETLFAVACTDVDDRGQASIASMYLKDGIGWGEIFASQPLRDLLGKYPGDVRSKLITPKYKGADTLPAANNATAMFNYFEEEVKDGVTQILSRLATVYCYNGSFYSAQNGGGAQVQSVGGGRYSLVVNGAAKEGYLVPNIEDDRETGYPVYYVTKFSYQDGKPMLSSPVMLRLAEVILNRAEAKFKSNNPSGAVADLNLIRRRANAPDVGSAITLDTILDERRRELCFEGHRAFDLLRNGLPVNRRYSGAHPAVLIEPANPRNIYYIPNTEIEVSGIPQNP